MHPHAKKRISKVVPVATRVSKQVPDALSTVPMLSSGN